MEVRPAEIQYFMEHSLKIGHDIVKHVFAIVKYLKPYISRNGQRNERLVAQELSSVLSIWENRFEALSAASFVPVQRIYGRYGFMEMAIDCITKSTL